MILVAGASGHLGRQIVAELKSRGLPVRGTSRHPERLAGWGTDEAVAANLADPASLAGICEGVDAVISCAGASMNIMDLRDRSTFTEVDYRGNLALLEEARRSKVRRFIYVSLFGAEQFRTLEYAVAHERFVEALRKSGLDYAVIRPTGFFSFNAEIFRMAAKGRVMLIGSGECRTNPVHDRDVAAACADALDMEPGAEIPVGGPTVYTRRQVAELAFEVLGHRPRINAVPAGLFRAMIAPVALLNPRIHALMAFGAAVSTTDSVAPVRGERGLRSYFEELNSSAGTI